MQIVVLGSGAMGCIYGGRFAEAGFDVTLVDIWKEHIDTINRDGLRLEGVGGTRHIRNLKAVTSPAESGKADLLVVFVKATTTREAIAAAKSLVHPDTIVLTLQNGLGNIEAIAQEIDAAHIVAGVSGHGGTLLGVGHVRHAGAGYTKIGEISGELTPRVKNLAELFRKGGFAPVELSDNVLGLIWDKLMANVAINAITAVTGIKNGQILDFPEAREISMRAVQEAASVAEKKGVKLSGDPEGLVLRVIRDTAENRSSMLQDVTRHKMTEIDVINGAIVREAKALGVEAPVNEMLSSLVKVIQGSYPKV